MPDIIFDFTEAQEFDRTPVPPGIYHAVIDASYAREVKYGKDKGTPYITLGFSITSPEEYAGRVVFNNYMIAGKGAGNTRSLLRLLGFYSDGDGDMFRFNPNALHGIEVAVRVRERTLPSGDTVNEVAAVMLPTENAVA